MVSHRLLRAEYTRGEVKESGRGLSSEFHMILYAFLRIHRGLQFSSSDVVRLRLVTSTGWSYGYK